MFPIILYISYHIKKDWIKPALKICTYFSTPLALYRKLSREVLIGNRELMKVFSRRKTIMKIGARLGTQIHVCSSN